MATAMVKVEATFLAVSPDGRDALIGGTPYGDFDPYEDMCMIHRIGSSYADGPVTFQSALTHGSPWENPPSITIVVVLDVLSASKLTGLT